MMPRSLLGFGLLAGLLAAGVGWTRSRAPLRGRAPAVAASAEPERHKVTPRMLRDAEGREARTAPPVVALDGDGRRHDLAASWTDGPSVLVFIKDGCPCSVSAETYWNSLHAAHRGRVRFYGVIDGDEAVARAWGARNGVPFPILADPDLAVVRAFRAENSAYVALVDARGKIDSFWPGYSSAMLQALNARIASLSGLPEPTIDTDDAPEDLYSGCPFDAPASP